MKTVAREGGVSVFRLDKGEELVSSLKSFCRAVGAPAGFFSAVGAASRVVLSWYDLTAKQYVDRQFTAPLEVVSLTGNVAAMGDDVVVHAHGCFSGKDFQVLGGHVKECVVAGTCEIVFTHLAGPLERAHDEETGLNLLE